MKTFESVYSELLSGYVEFRKRCGIKNIASECCVLRKLDRFIWEEGIKEIVFTKEHAEKWKCQQGDEAPKTRYTRVNTAKLFFDYLYVKGYPVTKFRDIRYTGSTFSPHIYSEDEIERYFKAVDNYYPKRCRKNLVQLPVLFRILYCCGTRLSETLNIRKRDVDLESGIIKLVSTKKSKERYVVMSDSLLSLMRQYAEKTFYEIPEKGFIFTTYEKQAFSNGSIEILHRRFLQEAGIPYIGNGKGPRIHDFRHTFAVNAFKQMIDKGMDLYVALPIMSAYLGHESIVATEHYLRMATSMYPYIEDKFKDSLKEAFSEY